MVAEGYKQTEVGVIPDDWETPRIDAVCKLINGRGFKPHEWSSNGLPIIRIQNLNGSDEFNYFQGSYAKKIEVERGQLLFAWSGSRGTSFGPHIWNGSLGVLNYHTWKVVVNHRAIHESYFLHALRILTKEIENSAHGASALVHTQKWEMETFEFPLPPTLEEQEAIAGALSDADAWIESLEKLIHKKRQIKQGTMQTLLSPWKLEGDTKILKEGWIEKHVGSFTDCTAGGTPSTTNPSFWGGNIPWMNSGELNLKKVDSVAGRITNEGLKSSSTKLVPENCILIGLAGQGKTRGTVAYNTFSLCTNQSIACIYPNESFSWKFLYYNLDSRYEELRELSTGDGGRGGLNLTIIRNLVVAMPPHKEQTRIATILSDMDEEITALERKLAKAQLIKQGMMQELLTGKTRLV